MARYQRAYPSNEFHYEYCVVNKEGELLSEFSFQHVRPFPNAAILVEYSYKYNILDLTGNLLFPQPVDCIFGIYDGLILFVNEGVLYRSTMNGRIEKRRELQVFNEVGEFYCGNGHTIIDGVTSDGVPMDSCKYFSNGYHGISKIYDDTMPLDKRNILIKGRFLLFDNW